MHYLDNLNPNQDKAVRTIDGPLLVVAGAGSGKTRVLTSRIANIVNHGTSMYNILAVTFTNKAAAEMKERVSHYLGPASRTMWISTFHSMSVRILRVHADKLGYTNSFTIIDDYQRKKIIKEIITNKLKKDATKFKPQAISSYISNIKYNMPLDDGPIARLAEEVYPLYQKNLKSNNAMDFQDLLINTYKLFNKFPDVLESYQDKFKYILIDEYQDTNETQYKIVNLLASKHKNIFIVGDEDQSIYSFRGACSPDNFNSFKSKYNPEVIKLEENYRSTKNILGAANSLIINNSERMDKNLYTSKPEGPKVTIAKRIDGSSEAEYVVEKINILKSQGLPLKNIAILYRKNALSRIFEEKLNASQVNYKIYGSLGFFDRLEVKDMLAYIKLTLTPEDNFSFERVVNKPKRSIGGTTIDKMKAIAEHNDAPLFAVAANAAEFLPTRTATSLTTFVAIINNLRSIIEEYSFIDFFEKVLFKSGYITQFNRELQEDKDRLENIQELKNTIIEHISKNEKEVEGYTELNNRDKLLKVVDDIMLASNPDEDENVDAVNLMTVHSSKGLEFPVVFMVGTEDGVFPSMLAQMNGEIDEERRLAYVAITRAKEKLFITYARSRTQYGKTQYNEKSIFIDEINSAFTVNEDEYRNAQTATRPKINIRTKPLETRRADNDTTKENYHSSPVDIKEGDRVMHTIFGEGMVVDITADPKIKIAFKEGIKTLNKSHKAITKL